MQHLYSSLPPPSLMNGTIFEAPAIVYRSPSLAALMYGKQGVMVYHSVDTMILLKPMIYLLE